MKVCIGLLFILVLFELKSQNNTIDYSSHYNIDYVVRQNRNFAKKNDLLEVKAYFYSQDSPSDSTLCLLEQYDTAGRILYKKDFHYYDKKAYEEFTYSYDSIGRLVKFKQQDTYGAPSSYNLVILEYDRSDRVSKFINSDTFYYSYYPNGLIKNVQTIKRFFNNKNELVREKHEIEYVYDTHFNLHYEIENSDTNRAYYYDVNNCLLSYYIKDIFYTVIKNDKNCDPVETFVYYAKGAKKTNSLDHKINRIYENGLIKESIFGTHRLFGNRMKISNHRIYEHDSHGLLVKTVELKQFGKIPRITNYHYKRK